MTHPGVTTAAISVECNVLWAKAHPDLALKAGRDFYAEAKALGLTIRPVDTRRKGFFYLRAGRDA